MKTLTDQGNNASMDISSCANLIQWFGDREYDIILLAVFYYIIAVVTVIANGLLLYKLLKKKQKRRTDKLFTILSLSDICVGLVSVPVTSLPFFITDFEILCKLSPSLIFFFYFPYIFSWTMVIIISVDRALMVTGSRMYQKFVTMKVLYFVIAFLLVKDILSVTFMSLYLDALEFSNKLLQFTFLFIESFFIFSTVISYLYLLYFVKSKSKKMRPFRHTLNQYEKRLTVKVIVIFICLVIFTMPQFIGIIFTFYFDVESPTIKRNIVYWKAIMLYSNSSLNAIILLIDFHRSKRIICCNVVSFS